MRIHILDQKSFQDINDLEIDENLDNPSMEIRTSIEKWLKEESAWAV